MDRNLASVRLKSDLYVALRKESVDRNQRSTGLLWVFGVALRKESVDRNSELTRSEITQMSLSARRAWIEIYHGRL